MKNINKFNDFVNEGLFSKGFNGYIKDIDKLFIQFSYNDGHMFYIQSIKDMADIATLIDTVLMKYGRTMDQDDMDRLLKRFNALIELVLAAGYYHNDDLTRLKQTLNSNLNILRHLKRLFDLSINLIPARLIDETMVFYVKDDHTYIVTGSTLKRKEEEARAAAAAAGHADVDPLGEENWDN